jgi:ABC-2 type transport system permease protein
MIADIWTVMVKEWREYLAGASGRGSGRGRGVVGVLLVIGVISILLPLQQGKAWLVSGAPILVNGLYLPFTILLNVVADTFAGERERHTLETLLASRLSDRAILFGKVGAAVAYGMAVGVVAALVQAVVANLSQKNADAAPGLTFYPLGSVVDILIFGLLMTLLAASAGSLVSLRASTTRQAQQILGFGFLVLVFVPIIIIQLLPRETQANLAATLNSANPTEVVLIIWGVLLVVDVTLLLTAMARFQRARLIMA